MKKLLTVFFLLGIFGLSNGQVKIQSVGAYAGFGNIKGNSTGVASFTTSIFFDANFFFSEAIDYRFSFFYARKFEALLPDQSNFRYFPFHKGLSIKAILRQPLTEYFFLEEGIGLLALNDQTFSDTDVWAFGTAFHLLAGLDFTGGNSTGFKIGVGSEVGLTFIETTPQFFSLHFQTVYYF